MSKRQKISLRAREILASHPEGMRWSELVRCLQEAFPDERDGTITGSTYNFARSDEVYRPAKGVLCLATFKAGGSSQVPEPPKETETCSKEYPGMSLAANMKDQLEKYVKRVMEFCESCRGKEAVTKQTLIAPLFRILGYDMADPRECEPEYKADFGKVRGKQPVDWAFFVNHCLGFLVEAKAVGKMIDRYDEQLGDYFNKAQAGLKLSILTNGVQWRFFTDLVNVNKMDTVPFLEWDVLTDPIPYDFLTILQRDKFNPELITSFAKLKRRQSVLVAELTRLLEPSDEFVKLAIQNKEMLFENRNLNAKVIAEWKPILASAIQEWAQQQRLTDPLNSSAIDTPVGTEPSNFWAPIRRGECGGGVFAGKPVTEDYGWISKTVRGIGISLELKNHDCSVAIYVSGKDRLERRAGILSLLPADKQPDDLRESPRSAVARFPACDKGRKDREHWDEARKKLVALGEEIYNKIKEAGV